ncbi:hypothetical protein PIB30_072643 [Stylosanthes scabra]|uniref:Uncharacterized protein n=1 Tax=Stylosanthes scabra TaxID=79078 RepID=A0ABU6XP45_9FABA|nr:hypothetical protein [Stylosanthes scabra]
MHHIHRRSTHRLTLSSDDRQRFLCSRGTYKMFGMENSDNMEITNGDLANQTQYENEAQTEKTVNKKKKATTSDVWRYFKKVAAEMMG